MNGSAEPPVARPAPADAPERRLPFPTQALLRDATPADAGPLAELERACFADPWSESSLAAERSLPGALIRIAVEGSEILGYASFRFFPAAGDEAELLRLGVAPSARRRGLGSALLEDGLRRLAAAGARLCHLEVDEANAPAIALYEAAGFHRIGRRGDYFGPGRAALLYARSARLHEAQET